MYENIVATICSTSGSLSLGVQNQPTKKDIKLAYQHLGGKLINVPNVRHMIIKTAVLEDFQLTISIDSAKVVPPTHQLMSEGTKN